MPKPFDPHKPVQLRSGRPARIICHNVRTQDERPLGVLVETLNGKGEVFHAYPSDGKMRNLGIAGEFDLINTPSTYVRWVVLSSNHLGNVYGASFETEDLARSYASMSHRETIAIKQVTFTEGEGLPDAAE